MNPIDDSISRRLFLQKTGQVLAAGTVLGGTAARSGAEPLRSDHKIRMGVVGGGFGAAFQWHEDPNCIVHAVSDLRADRRDALMKTYKCERSYESLEKLILDKDIDAVAIFTEAPNHVRHAVACMEAGKHVISAVPAAMTIEECHQLLDAKRRTNRTYMMAETSYYRYYTIAARDLFNEGKFGTLFYSEVEYYHPGVCWPANDLSRTPDGKGRTWRYGFPPMHYPTHSLGFLVGVTKERLTEVSCLGWGNPGDEALKDNVYKAPFNVQSALLKTNKGHICRANVFWDGRAEGERAQWFGTDLAFYMPGSGGQPFRIDGKNAPKWKDVPTFWERLPEPMRHESGHGGSHTFLTHEFIAALVEDREPTVNIREALAMTAPGIVAHASSLKGGEQMKVPSFDA